MIRSIVFPRVLGQSLDDLQPALELFRAFGFAPGNEWHEGAVMGSRCSLRAAASSSSPHRSASVDAMVEVSDADAAYEIVKKLVPIPASQRGDRVGHPRLVIRKEIGDTPYGARLFEVEVSGLRIGFLTYAKKPARRPAWKRR